MRPFLQKLLRCPTCGGSLNSEVLAANSERVEEGLLRCAACAAEYPVIAGIPRMLPADLAGELPRLYPQFFRHYAERFRISPGDVSDSDDARTLRSFSFQWNAFGDMYELWEENFLDYVHPLEPSFFQGKLGLDAGCGFGRHMHQASKFGAEMVGLDLSDAVRAAAKNNADDPRCHVVQGDLFRPPFAPGTFDFAYSIGVLHHTPDPPRAFRSVVPMVKKGGTMAAWVYGPRLGAAEAATRMLRRFTTRMDPRALYALCLGIAVNLRVFSHLPYRALSRVPPLAPLAERLPIHDHHRYPFKVVVADAFDRLSVPLVQYYTGDELRQWFESAGLEGIVITRRFANNESWRGNGRVPT